MNQCPAGQICQTQVTTGGSVKIGSFEQELPAGAIRITGYIGEPDETGDLVLKPPVTGRQLESAPVEVPGGLIGGYRWSARSSARPPRPCGTSTG